MTKSSPETTAAGVLAWQPPDLRTVPAPSVGGVVSAGPTVEEAAFQRGYAQGQADYAEAREHELGHFQLYQATAREIERSLSQLPTMRKCQTLESEANRIGNLLMKTGNEVNVEYDRRTEHGAKNGARLSN